jgi:hypothetical protein
LNPIKEMMQQAHENQSQPIAQSQPLKQSPVATQGVKQRPVSPRPATPPAQPRANRIPTELKQIARPDVPVDHYGVKGVQLHFQPYNKVLRRWLKDFSSENQSNGGCAITKTQVMEMMLDIMMYDLEILPLGYETQQEMREDILEKMKNYR